MATTLLFAIRKVVFTACQEYRSLGYLTFQMPALKTLFGNARMVKGNKPARRTAKRRMRQMADGNAFASRIGSGQQTYRNKVALVYLYHM
jgi:hypothetical protein